ncbi:hypothetical protein LUR56_31120 [Streptomyces sp. MT29]|nr:hypothetical protein [Streptomyces sp. MT29]
MSSNTREHFTAWFTNDRTCLEGVLTDVTVLPDELIGDASQGDARGPRAASRCSTRSRP